MIGHEDGRRHWPRMPQEYERVKGFVSITNALRDNKKHTSLPCVTRKQVIVQSWSGTYNHKE